MQFREIDRMNRRTFLQLTGGVALATFSASCVRPAAVAPQPVMDADEPQRGGILRIAVTEDVTNLDPTRSYSDGDEREGAWCGAQPVHLPTIYLDDPQAITALQQGGVYALDS